MHILAAGINNVGGVATLEGFEGVFQNIVGVLLALGGILLFIMLIAGGIRFITSGGDPKSLESAKMTITYALIGMILVALAYLVLVFVARFTGNTNLLNFRIRL